MIEAIHDEATHAKALRRIEKLWDSAPESPEWRELDALATLVDAYERKTFPIRPPDPIDAIEARRAKTQRSKRTRTRVGSHASTHS
jgi:HTH-type transcriptional regulator/antitoxin HigA